MSFTTAPLDEEEEDDDEDEVDDPVPLEVVEPPLLDDDDDEDDEVELPSGVVSLPTHAAQANTANPDTPIASKRQVTMACILLLFACSSKPVEIR